MSDWKKEDGNRSITFENGVFIYKNPSMGFNKAFLPKPEDVEAIKASFEQGVVFSNDFNNVANEFGCTVYDT